MVLAWLTIVGVTVIGVGGPIFFAWRAGLLD